jgi:hypothetical protein
MPQLIVNLMNYTQENYIPILGGIIVIIGILVMFSIINSQTKEIKKKNVTIETMNNIVYELPSEFSSEVPLEESLNYVKPSSMIDQICTKFDNDTDKINCKLMSKYGNFDSELESNSESNSEMDTTSDSKFEDEPLYYESTNKFNISEYYDLHIFNKLNNFNILNKM